MKEGFLTGHQVYVVSTRELAGIRRIIFKCHQCSLRGEFMASPPDLVDHAIADLMATHWAGTGGDR